MEHLYATAAWISVVARLLTGIACLLPRTWLGGAARPAVAPATMPPSAAAKPARRTRRGRRENILLFTNLWMLIAFATWAADAVIQS